jgi:hypothetical protein
MENDGAGVALVSRDEPTWEDTGSRLHSIMTSLEDLVDSPKALLVLRNATLTLLEAGEEFTYSKLYYLLSYDEYRKTVTNRLRQATPGTWSAGWNGAWQKDAEPLLSVAQEKMVRRNGLITFWSTEWMSIPEDLKAHVLRVVSALT